MNTCRVYYQVMFTAGGVFDDVATFRTKKEAAKAAAAFIRAHAPKGGTREAYISVLGRGVIRVTHPCYATVQTRIERRLKFGGDV
jgi:hypothetical protein